MINSPPVTARKVPATVDLNDKYPVDQIRVYDVMEVQLHLSLYLICLLNSTWGGDFEFYHRSQYLKVIVIVSIFLIICLNNRISLQSLGFFQSSLDSVSLLLCLFFLSFLVSFHFFFFLTSLCLEVRYLSVPSHLHSMTFFLPILAKNVSHTKLFFRI